MGEAGRRPQAPSQPSPATGTLSPFHPGRHAAVELAGSPLRAALRRAGPSSRAAGGAEETPP